MIPSSSDSDTIEKSAPAEIGKNSLMRAKLLQAGHVHFLHNKMPTV